MNQPRHVLKLSCGLTVELILDEDTGYFDCIWSRRPTKKMLPAIEKEYLRWRDEIFENFAKRTGKKVLLVTL